MLWSITILIILIYLFTFLSNYLKKFETGDKSQTSKDYWMYTYDVRKFKKATPTPQDSIIVTNRKNFKDRLVNCYWILVLLIFFQSCYVAAGIGHLIFK